MPNLAWTQWTAQDIVAQADDALASKRAGLDAVLAVPGGQRTLLNTIAALEYADYRLSDVQQQLEVLLDVHPDAAMRSAAMTAVERISAANIEMEYDRRLWDAVQAWAATDESLDAIDRKLADDVLRDMRRMGFALSDERFAELKRLTTELKLLEAAFEKAINDWEDHIEVSREQLAGLPDRYIEGLKKSGDLYLVTLQYPDLLPFMRLAEDSEARRQLATKDLRKGGSENLTRLAQLIGVRQHIAKLLGYASHADFACEVRMAKDSASVQAFLNGIITKLMPASRHELLDLIDIKKRTLGLEKRVPIHFHEVTYWSHRLLKERYDIDSERVKEYFPFEVVVSGMLGIYQEVLGIQFSKNDDARLWHKDAQLYEVRDGDRLLGHFVLDMFPRKGKYGHAASCPAVLGRREPDGTQTTGLMALVCNFPKPTTRDPSLLSHDEVETLFHEFGHICHALLSGGRWLRQNGFGVALDFVETPSQLFEEWAWEATVLKRITKHYQTGEPIPDELIVKMQAARHHMDANYHLQLAVKSLYDQRMHTLSPGQVVEPAHIAQMHRDMMLQYEAIDLPDDAIMAAGWSHMADYDAGYYSYLWSKVYAYDLYSLFKAHPLDAATGRRYREMVLEPGASRPEIDSVTAFLGREPSDAPFLEQLGIS